jgi:hypothetical protein
MNIFELNNDEIEFLKSEIEALINELEKINIKLGQRFNAEDLKKIKDYINAEKKINKDEYFRISKDIIYVLKDFTKDSTILKVILDFSRISSSVEDIYENFNLRPLLINYIGNFDYKATDYNKVLTQDYFYSYYYHRANSILQSGKFQEFVHLLKDDPILSKSENRTWVIKSIFSSLIDAKFFSQVQLKYLLSQFEDSLTDKIKKKIG